MATGGSLLSPDAVELGRAVDRDDHTGATSTGDEWDHTLWRRHLVMGIGSFSLANALLFGYLVLTPHGPHRGLLMALVAGGVACWLGLFAPVGILIIRTRWRVPFFFLWSLTTLALIATIAGLDGGAESAVTSLLVLPVLYAALVYPLTMVVALAAAAEVFYVIVALTGPVGSLSRVTMSGVALGLAGVIAVMAAVNRNAQNIDRRRLMARLHGLATHDGLTGCLTYQAFQDALDAESARSRRHGRPYSVVTMDLDSFKRINDTYGHDVGDETLRGLVRALQAAARTTDMVGRLGGDELAVLLPETDAIQAQVAAQRIQVHTRAADTPVGVTVSFGVATWSDRFDSSAELMRRADQALYAAKNAGRDRLVAWEKAASDT